MGQGPHDFPEEGRYLESQRHVEQGTAVHSTHRECQPWIRGYSRLHQGRVEESSGGVLHGLPLETRRQLKVILGSPRGKVKSKKIGQVQEEGLVE